ncbi:MAG: uroporphyrinogen-III C-methyltransferase [Thermoplasmata archaeon]
MKEDRKVAFVGSGPGDPEMMTLRAVREIEECDVLFFDSSIKSEVLDMAGSDILKIGVGEPGGHFNPVEVAEIMARYAESGKKVVRLKIGDPSIFCKTDIEIKILKDHGIGYYIVPGISSAFASAASAGIILTESKVSSTVCLASGMDSKNGRKVDWKKLASCADTIIVYLGSQDAEKYTRDLISGGMDPEMPAVIVCGSTLKDQKIIRTNVSGIPESMQRGGGYACTLIIGKVTSVS